MTQASHYLLTLAECCRHDPATPGYMRRAMEAAVGMVAHSPLACIICGTELNAAPSYLSLIVPHDLGYACFYGGLCLKCGANHERAWLQRHVEARAHFAFGEPAGHA